ncbi:MAG: hypothetical protein D3903_21250 [Candidatus Electrothrix sp. GM3_4]|nr:hypothetical protein [Candidatus Electrothrix sp. GM3_4]
MKFILIPDDFHFILREDTFVYFQSATLIIVCIVLTLSGFKSDFLLIKITSKNRALGQLQEISFFE